jgi:hypothetical protein
MVTAAGRRKRNLKKGGTRRRRKGWVALASSLKIKTTGLKACRQATSFFCSTKPRSLQVPRTGKNGSSSAQLIRPPQVTMTHQEHRLFLLGSSAADQKQQADRNVHR